MVPWNLIKQVPIYLYPNYLSVQFFTEGWAMFFTEEIHILSVLIGIVFLWHFFIAGLALASVATHVVVVIGFRRFMAGGLCASTKRLGGQTVIITGANSGIGKETARDLLRRGAHVILACRDIAKAEAARDDIRVPGGKVEVKQLDLSSLESVRNFAKGIINDNVKVHILINNAGVFTGPYTETADGFELHMASNHLGHFLLTNLLLQQMMHGEPARIINVSSALHLAGRINCDDIHDKAGYGELYGLQSYSNTKLANVLFTRQLAKLLKGKNIEVFSLHPGSVSTAIERNVAEHPSFLKWAAKMLVKKTPLEGAQTTVYCATEARQNKEMYFSDCAVGWASSESKDEDLAEKLWNLSAALVQLEK